MSNNEYFVLMGKGSLKSFHPKFKKLGGFYTGFGWAFPSESETELNSIIHHLPNHTLIRQPLGSGQSFEAHRQVYLAKFFKKNLKEVDGKLQQAATGLSLEELSIDSIQASDVDEETKNGLVELLVHRESLMDSIAHAEGMEKALKAQASAESSFSINFICEQAINYLVDEAPEMPRLVNYLENGKPKPFIPKGIVAQLVGAGGVGKTHALAQLALSVVTGSNWLGIYPIEHPGYVFMGLGENKDDDIHRLLKKIVKNQMNGTDATFFSQDPLKEATKRLSVKSFTGQNSTFISNGAPTLIYNLLLAALKEKEPEEGWSLIILDPISRFMGADAENDNAAATQFIALLERMTLELKGKPTVIFGHHMNKSGLSSSSTDQGAARGSSAITDGVRWQANLERIQKDSSQNNEGATHELNQINLRHVKSNFTAILSNQKLIKDENGLLKADAPRILNKKK